MKTIHHVIDIRAPRERVHEAITTGKGLAGWWSTKVEAEEREGGTVAFTFEEGFNPRMQITKLTASALDWRCTGGHEPWQDNEFSFEIVDQPFGCRLRFWQHYARELSDDEFGIYNFNWGYYLESLRLLVTEGTGKPYAPSA